ncbi:spermatogenesis-associated protein 19, mitochondrial [Mauremys mutica]|uniref:spermatogenesis-associated protein 19, mitochondrial n=1 Tax=Mauremys mutica TaxID=74926 RepID=UPI001D166E25|nr:spermatogenesis-associated protein 19, mitochondrial [Mauremys mutica]
MQQCCTSARSLTAEASSCRRGELRLREDSPPRGEDPPRMIISTWGVYILMCKSIGRRFPPSRAPDIKVVETEMLSVLEHWLRKIEEEASKIFKQKVENKAETKATPSAGQGSGMTKSQSVQVSSTKLPVLSSSRGLLEERTKIQFIRWSQTRVYRVSSDMRNEAMRERLEQVRNSVSQVMLQAMQNNRSNTEIRATLSS